MSDVHISEGPLPDVYSYCIGGVQPSGGTILYKVCIIYTVVMFFPTDGNVTMLLDNSDTSMWL